MQGAQNILQNNGVLVRENVDKTAFTFSHWTFDHSAADCDHAANLQLCFAQ